MYKNLLMIVVAAIALWACGGQNTASTEQTTEQEEQVVVVEEATAVTVANFKEKAADLIDKEVLVEGTVTHVCKHGGKKMFIVGEDPEKRVKINASDKVSVFEPELEGSVVVAMGIIEPIEEEAVPEEEKKNEDADHTNYYHVPQYAISCMTFKEIEE